jgi:branched-chain amino acid transport system substrate-binding protein
MRTAILKSMSIALSLLLAGGAHAQLKLAVAGPVTGANAAFGAQLTQGVQQAAEDINKAGGILGQKIEVEVGDDVSDPKQGVSVANKFVGDGVKFVVGHFNSGVTIPASDVYAENGVLFITPSATNPKITDRKLWDAFRTCGRDDQQGMVWAELARDKLKGKKIAVIHDKTTYGKGLADAALDNMHKFGVKEVLYEGVNTGEKDYSALVSKIKQSGADLIYWGGLYTEGGLIVRQMRDQGVKAPLMGGDGITSDEFASVGGPGVEGTLMTYGPDPRNKPGAKKVVEEFRAKKFEPEAYTLYSYAGVQIIKQAAEAAKSLDPKKVAEKMHSGMLFKTVLGDLAYDKKGDITKLDYVMYIWKKDASGKIGYVECPGSDCTKVK